MGLRVMCTVCRMLQHPAQRLNYYATPGPQFYKYTAQNRVNGVIIFYGNKELYKVVKF